MDLVTVDIYEGSDMKRVGIVGCGGIARVHAWALQQMEDICIVGFADIRRDRAEAFALEYTDGKAGVYDSLPDMLAGEKPDVVHICTPHYLHVPMAIETLKGGASFFSEKPPAISMEQFEMLEQAMNAAKKCNGRRLFGGFCFQNRYNATIRKTDEILQSGNLGEVRGVRAFVTWRRDEDYYATDWKGRLDTEGGGALINQSIHTLDLMLRYLGSPTTVKASIANHHLQDAIEVEDTVEAWMNFEGGKRACFYASTAYATDAPVILEIQCDTGSINIIDKTLTVRKSGEAPQFITVENDQGTACGVAKDYWGNSHLTCIRDFYEKMDNGERFQNDLEGVKNTMATMMKIYDYR